MVFDEILRPEIAKDVGLESTPVRKSQARRLAFWFGQFWL